jgi:hypothetical protein
MSLLDFSTRCPCGEFVRGQIKKPSPYFHEVKKLACKCGSTFLMTCKRRRQQGQRVFQTDFEILELSSVAESLVKGRTAIERVGKKVARFVRFPGTQDGVILTDMDEREG